MRPLSGIAAVAASLVLTTAIAAPPQYTIVDLGTLGGAHSQASGLGPQGWVVGSAADASGDVEGYAHSHGVMQPLGRRGAPRSWGTAVNARGAIAFNTLAATVPGSISSSGPQLHDAAYLFDFGTLTSLGSLGGGGTFAWGMNDADVIVGESRSAQQRLRPFLWSQGRIFELPLPSASPLAAGVAYDINARGQAVGWGDVSIGDCCDFIGALLWENGGVAWLPWLAFERYARAQALNDDGVVVGAAQDRGFRWRPVRWRKFVVQDLGTLGGATGFALDINSAGDIVGVAADSSGAGRAFWWSEPEGMHELGSLVVDLTGWRALHEARAINDAGQIAGVGQRDDGSLHAFLLTPAVKIFDWPWKYERLPLDQLPEVKWRDGQCPPWFCDMFPP